jgi:hypothetical protein
VPWKMGSADFDIPLVIAELEHDNPAPGSARHDLVTALRHARSRADEDPWKSPRPVRYAQAVLEIAVEWSMPAVERWAVAWLMAAGGRLRLRWSSRSRDGQVRRDGLAPARVTAMADGPHRVIIGCDSGSVGNWSNESGLSPVGRSASAIWTVTAAGERIFAAGAGAHFLTHPADWALPSLRSDEQLQVAGVTAAAMSPYGVVACGDELGTVLICLPGESWVAFPSPDEGSRVVALSFRGRSAVRAVWRNGWIAESASARSGVWAWARRLESVGQTPVVAAAFDSPGQRLALAGPDGTVSVVEPPATQLTPGWPAPHLGVRSLAWSPGGLLASSGPDAVLIGEPGTEPEQMRGDGAAGLVAFLGVEHLVTARDFEVVQWSVRGAGSLVPDLVGEDRITAIAIDPADPGQTMAGTWQGRLLHYDARGSPTPLLAGDHRRGHVNQLARAGDAWLIATQGGAYLWRPEMGQTPQPLAHRLCLTVAARGEEGAFAANHEVHTLSGEHVFSFETAVQDIRYGPDWCIAAIDALGSIRARDSVGEQWQAAARDGSRLLAVDERSVQVWSPGGEVMDIPRYGEYSRSGRLPALTKTACRFDARRIVVACPGGLGLVENGWGQPDAPTTGVAARVETADTDGGRILVAAGKRIAGYDLLEPAAAAGNLGMVALSVGLVAGTYSIKLRQSPIIKLSAQHLAGLTTTQVAAFERLLTDLNLDSDRLWESVTSLTIEQQSALTSAAGRLGELIWQAGLDLAIDLARGDDPQRPVRLEWHCDDAADEIPWELVHPSAATLGWFDDPPTTVVRSIRSAAPGGATSRPIAGGSLARYTMQVIRGEGAELDSSDTAYQQTRRRTRRTNVELLSPRPEVIAEPDDLRRVIRRADILQVWAHCGPDVVRFSGRAVFPALALADRLAACSPRLVVLVGCKSGALGRALVQRGVTAVVAMRGEVYSHTVQPLVEDLVSLVLAGQTVDLAFAEALKRYVLTGQPGAVAIPMLYLAAGSDGRLFASGTPAIHLSTDA